MAAVGRQSRAYKPGLAATRRLIQRAVSGLAGLRQRPWASVRGQILSTVVPDRTDAWH